MRDNFEENIHKLKNYVSNIFNGFNVCKSLQKSEYNEVYNKDKYFWGITIYSLQREFLLELAKIFEKREKNVLSVYHLLIFLPSEEKEKINREINNHNCLIENIKKLRNKILAHHDIISAYEPQELFKKFPIKNNEVEELLNLLEKILGMIHSAGTKTGQSYSFRLIQENSKRYTENIINKLKIGYETERE